MSFENEKPTAAEFHKQMILDILPEGDYNLEEWELSEQPLASGDIQFKAVGRAKITSKEGAMKWLEALYASTGTSFNIQSGIRC